MHKTTISIVATTFAVASITLSYPARATKVGAVASACIARGTECTVTTEGGGNKYCFDNSKSGQGTQCVKCPSIDTNGDCSVAQTGGGKGTNIEGVMRAPARKPVH